MFGRITFMTSAVFAGSLLASVAAYAADTVKPAVLYDLGGKFDKSFNEGVFNGATKFNKETGIDFRDSRSRTSCSASRSFASSPRTASRRSLLGIGLHSAVKQVGRRCIFWIRSEHQAAT